MHKGTRVHLHGSPQRVGTIDDMAGGMVSIRWDDGRIYPLLALTTQLVPVEKSDDASR